MPAVMSSVERFTELAHAKLKVRQDDESIRYFKLALDSARTPRSRDDLSAVDDDYAYSTVLKCTVNLGAALVAIRRCDEALKYLLSVSPPPEQHAALAGDLSFNIAVAYELLAIKTKSRSYYQKALESYSKDDVCGKLLSAAVACKLAAVEMELNDFKSAAESYTKAALLYRTADATDQLIVCVFQKALALHSDGRLPETGKAVADCVTLCQQSDPTPAIATILNEIGLIYAELKKHDDAVDCFHCARTVIQQTSNDKKFEAVILQNIGAIHNCKSEFKESIKCNKMAASLYAQSSCRNGQGQCFINIAYAYSQLSDVEVARDYYLHARQAAIDTNDKHMEWQALEGLSCAAFCQQKFQQCVDYLKLALVAVSSDQLASKSDVTENESSIQQRLVNKLMRVVNLQASKVTNLATNAGSGYHSMADSSQKKNLVEKTTTDVLQTTATAVKKNPDEREVQLVTAEIHTRPQSTNSVTKPPQPPTAGKESRGGGSRMTPDVVSPPIRSTEQHQVKPGSKPVDRAAEVDSVRDRAPATKVSSDFNVGRNSQEIGPISSDDNDEKSVRLLLKEQLRRQESSSDSDITSDDDDDVSSSDVTDEDLQQTTATSKSQLPASSMPMHTAPQPPSRNKLAELGTYMIPQDNGDGNSGHVGDKYNGQPGEPVYASIPMRTSDSVMTSSKRDAVGPPTLPARKLTDGSGNTTDAGMSANKNQPVPQLLLPRQGDEDTRAKVASETVTADEVKLPEAKASGKAPQSNACHVM